MDNVTVVAIEGASIATEEGNGRTPTTDIIVGSAMMVLSIMCGLSYSAILTIIYRDKELFKLPSYKIMFTLGIYDIVQLFPHFMTGIFTITQNTFGYGFGKYMGSIATPGYVGYAVLTIILSINRFIQVAFPRYDPVLFSPKTVYVWLSISIFISACFSIALASPYATIIYFPDWYSWDYDRDNYKYSQVVQDIEEFIEVGGIFVSGFLYLLIVILLCRTRQRFMASKKSYAEIKILIQAFVVTAYCSVLNILWHNYQVLLPQNLWSYMALNFMWIFNSGIYPLIYFIVNGTIRKRLQAAQATTVSMFVRPKQSSISKEMNFSKAGERTKINVLITSIA